MLKLFSAIVGVQLFAVLAVAKAAVPTGGAFNARDPNLALDRRAPSVSSAHPFVGSRSSGGAALTTQAILNTASFGTGPSVVPILTTATGVSIFSKSLPMNSGATFGSGTQPSTK